ncbi:hypothetical protein ACP2W0_18520 [Pseudobacillus badius]
MDLSMKGQLQQWKRKNQVVEERQTKKDKISFQIEKFYPTA